MTLVAVASGTFTRGFDGIRTSVPDAYTVLELRQALEHHYKTDAHAVAYVIPGATRQPRVNKPGLPTFDRPLEMGVFFADVDNPNHTVWDDEMWAAAMEQFRTLDVLQTAGVYHTAHGRRIVQPLETSVPVPQVEAYLNAWLHTLEDAGLPVDWVCRDWTRHYRLPHVVRAKVPYRSPFFDLSRMRPIPLPAPRDESTWTRRKSGIIVPASSDASPREPVPNVAWSADVPPVWRDRVPVIAAAVAAVDSEWHTLFLALAGALLGKKVPPEHVPVLCRAISRATGADTRTEDREAAARTTVQRWLAKQPTTGYTQLETVWPGVAEAVDQVTARGLDARMRTAAAEPAPVHERTAEESSAELCDILRNAPLGVTLVGAECGLGKTNAAIQVAIERAATSHKSKKGAGKRAPRQSKTVISLDKNALAVQVAEDLTAGGVPVRRIFGPLSVKEDDGKTHVCKMADVAKHLVKGGQSMQRELCEGRGITPCPHHDSCKARLGAEGPEDARIIVGHHSLLRALDDAAGATGLLVIDEPPELLTDLRITPEDLELTEKTLGAFHTDYVDALRPALLAVRAWLEAPIEMQRTGIFKDIIRDYATDVDPQVLHRAQMASMRGGDAVECGANAPVFDARSKAPPIRQVELHAVRRSPARAHQVGTASRVLGAVQDGLATPWNITGSVEYSNERPAVSIHAARRDMIQALRRNGAVVVMDASIDVHTPMYIKALGYEPALHRLTAGDGAPIARTHLRYSGASRTRWMPRGRLLAHPGIVAVVRSVISWALEDPDARTLGLITFKRLRLALEAILHPDDPAIRKEWEGSSQLDITLEALRASLGPVLAAWPGEILFGHYGAIRGLNTMSDVDCLATIGDPWPDIAKVRRDMSYTGLSHLSEGLTEALCRAELEQAQGRLRFVHRKRPGRALHVGRVLPGGSGWKGGNVVRVGMKQGRPPVAAAMSADELAGIVEACGGVRGTARRCGCSHQYIQQCLQGLRPVSVAMAEALREQGGGGKQKA